MVQASAQYLGINEPCQNTNNYLEIEYGCKIPKISYDVTECGSEATLSCGAGYTMKVTRAYYGRRNKDTCRHWAFTETGCQSSYVLPRVQSICNGVRKCSFKVNWFGNPCWGKEYFQATYQCILQNKPTVPIVKTICENDPNGAVISCPNSQIIPVLRAVYGQSDDGKCDDSVGSGYIPDKCSSIYVMDKVEKECKYKNSCKISANSQWLGDPCPATTKQLDVTYYCQ